MASTMRAAVQHMPGKPLTIDHVPVPELGPADVLVQVMACGIIPNMNNIFGNKTTHATPELPAVLGLDAAGVVTRVGADVIDIEEGERVYINPSLYCGSCHYCRRQLFNLCVGNALRGYFGFRPKSQELMKQYPYGGFAEFNAAPARNLVKLPAEITFEQAGRFGYLGTSYAALRAVSCGPGSWVLINGVTGTLGVGAVLWALGLGATRILGLGRNTEVLEKVQRLAPRRIETLALGSEEISAWVRARTEELGADIFVDCTGRGSSTEATISCLNSLKSGGIAVTIGALREPIPVIPGQFMDAQLQYRGSYWFTVQQGYEMAELARSGVVNLGVLEPKTYPLEAVNQALDDVKLRPGGFTNLVVCPQLRA
jgi:alcohol dehydrogenase